MKNISDETDQDTQKTGCRLESSYEWENIFDSITDMITVHDTDYHIICANRAAIKNLKLPCSSTGPMNCFQYYHGTDRPPKGCPSCNCLKTGEPVNYEMFEPHLNKYIEIRAIPRYDHKNQITGIIHIVRDITKRKKSEKQIRASRRQLRKLNSYLLSIMDQEREDIAREIHDELGQLLMVMHMDLALLKKKFGGTDRSFHEITGSMSKILNMTIKTVRNISSNLRPKLLDELGLQSAIKWQVRKFQKKSGIICETTFSMDSICADHNRDTNIFRIIQEILTNIYRHAKATHVYLSLKENNGTLIMKVRDNGKGVTKAQIKDPKSLGLIGMRERVYFLKGEIQIYGERNKGTTVLIHIPLEKSRSRKDPCTVTHTTGHEIRAKDEGEIDVRSQ